MVVPPHYPADAVAELKLYLDRLSFVVTGLEEAQVYQKIKAIIEKITSGPVIS